MSEAAAEGGGSGRSAKARLQCVRAWGRVCGWKDQRVQKQGARKHPRALGREHIGQQGVVPRKAGEEDPEGSGHCMRDAGCEPKRSDLTCSISFLELL